MERETPSFPERAAPALLLFGVGIVLAVDAIFGPDGQRGYYLLYTCIGFLLLMAGLGRSYSDVPDLSPIETVWFGWTGMQSRRKVGLFLGALVIVSLAGIAGVVKLLSYLAWMDPIRAALFMAPDQFVLLLFWLVLGTAGGLWMLLLRLADAENARMPEMQRKQIAVLSFFFLITFSAVARHHAWQVALGIAAAFAFVVAAFMLLLRKGR